MSHLKNKVARRTARLTSVLLAVLMILTVAPIIAFPASAADGSSDFMRIFHLDCGRKYFSIDAVEKIIDELATNHYTHIQLAFGNEGLRLILNEENLTVKTSTKTYAGSDVKTALVNGNTSYDKSQTFSANQGAWNESQMTEIIKYAHSKGIKVIPMFDIPGHMNAVIAAMKELRISVSVYSQVGTNYPGNIGQSFDPTNTEANEFAKGLLINYIKFFGNIDGVGYFNIAGDECGFAKMDANTYTAYAKLMNALNAEVKAAGMTTLMFNDGVNYKNKTLNDNVSFDKDIVICYWTGGDHYATSTELASSGYSLINTNVHWYYVAGNESTNTGNLFYYGYAINSMKTKKCNVCDGGDAPTTYGCMLAFWCDNPTKSVNTSNLYSYIAELKKQNPTYFTATPDPVVTISATSKTLYVGQIANVSVTNATSATWTVEPADVLELSATSGTQIMVTAKKAGTAKVTATVNGTGYSVDIVVLNDKIVPSTTEIMKGNSITLSLASNRAVTWTVSDENVLKLNTASATAAARAATATSNAIQVEAIGEVGDKATVTASDNTGTAIASIELTVIAAHEIPADAIEIDLEVGGKDSASYDVANGSTATGGDATIATANIVEVEGKTTYEYVTSPSSTSLAGKTFYVASNATTTTPTLQLTFENAGNGQYYIKNASDYMYPNATGSYDWRNGVTWSYSRGSGKQAVEISVVNGYIRISKGITFTYTDRRGRTQTANTTAYLTISRGTSFDAGSSDSSSRNIYLYEKKTTDPKTTLTFTPVAEGETTYIVDGKTYVVNVKAPTETVNKALNPGDILTLPSNSSVTTAAESGYISVVDGKITVASNAPEGTTDVIHLEQKNSAGRVIKHWVYNITVSKIDFSTIASLPIQLWITNQTIRAEGTKQTGTGYGGDSSLGMVNYLEISAQSAYGENGFALSELIPAVIDGMYEWGGTNFTYDYGLSQNESAKRRRTFDLLRGVRLSSNYQKVWSDNCVLNGDDFNYVRYWGGKWEASADRINWWSVTGNGSTGAYSGLKEQLNAYYMQRTDVTDEVITDVTDWGVALPTDEKGVILDYAVKYPDGTLVPSEFPNDGKTMYFNLLSTSTSYRRILDIKALETSGYEVYMITVTPSSDSSSNTISITTGSKPTYSYAGTEKVAWVDDEANLPAKFQTADAKYKSISGAIEYTVGGDPTIKGVEIYTKQAMLVTYYLRPVVTKDSLTVHYRLKSDNSEFYSYNINVISGTVFKENIGLDDPWQGPLLNGDVKNDMGLIQQVSADLETIPAIAAQYRFAEYTCDSVVRSADGKDVYLYYTFNVNKSFVIDFGLPVTIKPAQIVDSLGSAHITNVLVEDATYGDVKVNADFSITYTPTKILKGKENLKVTFYGTNVSTHDDGFITYFISLIPASTMYYEEDFVTPTNAGATDNGAWTLDGTRKSAEQTLSELGSRDRYGFDSAYENGLTYSMGSAWKTTVNGTTYSKNNGWPTITFTFKGTGFDIISLTDNTSGTIIVEVKNSAGYAVKTMLVNNYYSQADGLYQIPVIKAENLSYDEYTVTIIVAYSKLFDTNNRGSYTFCLDAVRVYNTLGTGSDVDAVYANDGEAAPTFTEIRDITSAADFDVNAQGVFVDGDPNAKYDTYQRLGPNHEIYLARGQAIAFNVSLKDGQHLFIGAKSPNGGAVMNINDGAKTVAINTATDMYYEITPKDGRVIILNTGDNILSLTTIKITSDPATTTQNSVEFSVDENLLVYARATAYAIMHPFAPEHFEANWTTVKLFRKSIHTLTVRTSTDVDYITVDGEKVTTFYYSVALEGWGWNRKFVKYKVFTVSLDDDAELGDYEVIAYNADGEASEPHIATLTGKVGVGKFN